MDLSGWGEGAIGAFFLAIGLTLALNLGGATTWHVRLTFRLMAPIHRVLSRIPPWRQLNRRPEEDQMRQMVIFERGMGVLFALVGALILVGAVALAT